MKVPTEPTKDLKPDHLVGDGLHTKISSNKSNLWIKGDGCRIRLTNNIGSLHIIGDGCSVRVTKNLGSIEYIGDGGHILLGPESINRDQIKYTGDGGLIEFGDVNKKKEEKKVKREKKNDGKHVTVTRVTTTRKSGERNETKKSNVHVGVKVNVCVNNKVQDN